MAKVGTSQTDYSWQLRECGVQRHSAKAWLQGHGKYDHLSDRLRQKGTPEVLNLYLLLQRRILNTAH